MNGSTSRSRANLLFLSCCFGLGVACTGAADLDSRTSKTWTDSGDARATTHGDGSSLPADSGLADTSGETGLETGDPVVDADGDGHSSDTDCDDSNPRRYPDAPEVCGDGVINDCDGTPWDAGSVCESLATRVDALATWSLGFDQGEMVRASGVGDLNGDGLDDIAVGYSKWNTTELSAGAVFVYSGPVSGDYGVGDEDHAILGTAYWDSAGWDLAALGDVDGDGYDDFVVGAADSHHGHVSGTPAVYLVHGPGRVDYLDDAVAFVDSPTELECLGSVLEPHPDADGDGVVDLLVGGRCDNVVRLFSGAAATEQVPDVDDVAIFLGPTVESRFGHALATGDLDADGLIDVAVGDPEYHGSYVGYVSVFDGPVSGSVVFSDAVATVAASTTDSEMGYTLLGTGVALGDLNGDGYHDLAIGGPQWTTSETDAREEGIVLVYFGPVGGNYSLADAPFKMHGDVERQGFGGEMRSGRDLDGDGGDDLLVSSGYNEVNGNGASRRTFGNAGYVLRSPLSAGTWSALDADYRFIDEPTNLVFGYQASIAGDTNGDGAVEVLVGNWFDTIHLFDIPFGY